MVSLMTLPDDKQKKRPSLEVADIFRQYSDKYLKTNSVSWQQRKAINAIKQCRTSMLGGHMNACNNCGITDISYNSCRNRHCPKCQTVDKLRWIAKRESELLPVPYFHVVFTLPHELNPLINSNSALLYDLLFKAASETLLAFGHDKKRLGGELGATIVLHTWGQALTLHPHLHCIVPGGALTGSNEWVTTKSNYLFPVKAMAKCFKRCYLKKLYYYYNKQELQFHGQARDYEEQSRFNALYDSLWKKDWVVYAKKPFDSAKNVVRYLGRYTHRIALSNHRLVSIKGGKVSFLWRDYSDNNKQKIMTITANEFIRRYLQHVLPPRFTRIRQIGILANRSKAKKLALCNLALQHQQTEYKPETVEEIMLRVAHIDITQCRHCLTGKKKIVLTLLKRNLTPEGVDSS